MNLNSDRLFLKELDWEELENIHRLNSCPEVAHYNTLGIPESIEATREAIRPAVDDSDNEVRTHYAWAIYLAMEKKFLGQVGLKLAEERFKMAELYFNLIPDRWGKGFASEATGTVLEFGFKKLALHRIFSVVATFNHGSIRLLERLGMKREGMGRKVLPISGEWKDSFNYSILESEFRG